MKIVYLNINYVILSTQLLIQIYVSICHSTVY